MGKKCTPKIYIGYIQVLANTKHRLLYKNDYFLVKKKNLIGHVPIFEKVVHSSFHFDMNNSVNNDIKIDY